MKYLPGLHAGTCSGAPVHWPDVTIDDANCDDCSEGKVDVVFYIIFN